MKKLWTQTLSQRISGPWKVNMWAITRFVFTGAINMIQVSFIIRCLGILGNQPKFWRYTDWEKTKVSKSYSKSEDLDYLEPKVKGINRARVHPEVEIRTFFEDLLLKIREIPKLNDWNNYIENCKNSCTAAFVPPSLKTPQLSPFRWKNAQRNCWMFFHDSGNEKKHWYHVLSYSIYSMFPFTKLCIFIGLIVNCSSYTASIQHKNAISVAYRTTK